MREARTSRKRKSRPRRACKGSELRHKTSSIENGIFLYSEDGFGEGVGSVHYPNIKQWREGVKKEQEKG